MNKPVGPQLAEALGVILQRSFRAGFFGPITDELGGVVDSATYPVLSAVDRIGPSSAAVLGVEIGLDRSVVSRRASRLVGAGLLTGIRDPADARATLLTLTAAGHKIVAQTRNRLAVKMDARVADWDANDRTTFAELLARFAGLRSQAAPARDPSPPQRSATENKTPGPTS
jgi:DNA-binding MarR family transcriptional regulator